MSKTKPASEQQTPPGRLITASAVALLFSAWFSYLAPFVKFQFWQSDTFWLIETGRLILEKHCLPTHDPYSFTASASHWTVYQWLTEVIFAMAASVGGLTGVSIFGEVLLAILFCVLIMRRMLSTGTNGMVAILSIWLATYAFYPDISSLRPQLISFLLFWLLTVVCAESKLKWPLWKALVSTLAIAVAWANCHISFPIGLLILAANLAGSLISFVSSKFNDKKELLLFLAMLATFAVGTLITPSGLSLWSFLGGLRNLYPVQELQPLAWSNQPLLILIAVAALASSIYLRKKLPASDFIALAALVLVGSNCGRLIVYFCIFSCPVIGAALTQLLSARLSQGILGRFSDALKSVVMSRLYPFGLMLLSVYAVTSQPVYIRRDIPLQASKFLLAHPIAGNMFCSAHSGSYLIYSSHGAIPVFMDTRMDLYDSEFTTRFFKALTRGEEWQKLFDEYKITTALLPNASKLQTIVAAQPDWKPIYQDQDFSVYIRNSPP